MSLFDLFSSISLLGSLLVAISLWTVVGILRRAYFSPLSNIPGPGLAALTPLYEFYFDVIRQGQYTWQIAKLHEQYGPIIRISPYEVHINDPEFIDEVYRGNSEKWKPAAEIFGTGKSVFGTVPHELHRIRRAPLNGYFSKQAVNRLAPVIQSSIEALCKRMSEAKSSGQPFELGIAYIGLTVDIITEYSFAEPYGCLKREDLGKEWYDMMTEATKIVPLSFQSGWVMKTLEAMPVSMVKVMNPQLMCMIDYQSDIEQRLRKLKDVNERSKTTIFQSLLNGDLPPQEKEIPRLVDEGMGLVAAGANTTAHTLKYVTFQLLNNPDILHKLMEELVDAIPDPSVIPPVSSLEQLPYLSAIIQEALRTANSVPHRLQRVSTNSTVRYRGYDIPPGTPVGMSPTLIHENADLFPNPKTFKPERWLDADGKRTVELTRYLMPFGRGTRQCIGMNLAWAELYMTLGTVFRRFDMKLYQTNLEDVEVVHDFFNGLPKDGAKGLRVLIAQK
ncbi:putative cytochrome P450 [Rhizodiscina lignyota]|uniref:Cytochrome P450 n=1 Tax=Rhizodiscina lignyota TaxID=1504668 RepID=A0A9P4IDX8_9PEZI|nr:putative cytochrome P450 [Rhizodiscina lignyota]